MSTTPSASSGIPALPKFDNSLGALMIGGLVAMALWGVTCVQTYTFFSTNSRDQSRFKTLILFLWALDTFDSCLNGHLLYWYMVTNYLNPFALLVPVWSVIIHVAITSISNFIIRSLFAHRVYRLSHGNIPGSLWILAVSTTDLVCGIVISAKAFGISSYFELDHLSSLMYLNFAAGTTADISVALALCYLLHESRTGFKKTDSIITVLMQYTVNTGLIVAVDAALGMIMYIVMPHNLIFLGFYLLLSKLYLNSYLASLNARDGLRDQIDEPVSIHLSDISRSRFGEVDLSRRGSQSQISSPTTVYEKGSDAEKMAISVHSMVHTKVDGPQSRDESQGFHAV